VAGNGIAHAFVGALLAGTCALTAAAPIAGRGDWETYLVGRDAAGNAVPLLVAGVRNPALVFVYDTQYDLTWLAEWPALGQQRRWDLASAWAAGLSYVVGGTVYDDWRLPSLTDTGTPGCNFGHVGTDCGYNVQTAAGGTVFSEYALLWYTRLGNIPYRSTTGSVNPGWGLSNTGPFANLFSNYYWFGTEYAPDTTDAWLFYTGTGQQFQNDKSSLTLFAAVRDGDVLAGTVAEPATFGMLLAGLGTLAWACRGRARRVARRAPEA
jgi:hypothetical protein